MSSSREKRLRKLEKAIYAVDATPVLHVVFILSEGEEMTEEMSKRHPPIEDQLRDRRMAGGKSPFTVFSIRPFSEQGQLSIDGGPVVCMPTTKDPLPN